jgi:riboflavin kinase/FMN adenylyltransferase
VKIYYGFDEVKHIKNAVVTTGSFDGVHMGHQVILKKLNEIAKQENGESVLITFYPHPRKVLYPDTEGKDLLMINTRKEKIQLLEKAGLNHLIFVEFTKEFSETTAAEFVEEYLIKKLHTRKIVTGENHHFGKNRDGDIEELKELGKLNNFQVELIPHQDIQNVDVSSTLIRESIIRGKIEKANVYLTHPYFIIGRFTQGSSMYKRMGYITSRIEINEKYKLLPPCGSYNIDVINNGIAQKGIALISTCTNSLSESILDVYFKKPIQSNHFDKDITVLFKNELNVQDQEKKGSLLNSIMMKDLIRFDSNA